MPKYKLNGPYSGTYAGQTLGPWEAGAEVELDEETGAWIGRDSPGVIEEVGKRTSGKSGKDRQVKAAENRGDE